MGLGVLFANNSEDGFLYNKCIAIQSYLQGHKRIYNKNETCKDYVKRDEELQLREF